MPEQIRQLSISFGFFNRIKILTLDIFQQGNFKRFGIVKIANNRRQLMKLCPLSSAPAAFTRHNLIAIFERTHDNRLNNAMLCNAGRQFVQLIV